MVESPARIVAEQLVEVLGPFDLNGVGREVGVLEDRYREQVMVQDQQNDQECECRNPYR